MENNIILSMKHIRKEYPGVLALDNVNLDFAQGEIHAICGENGAGKSTLMKIVSGAIAPTSGSIEINDKTFSQMTPERSMENGISIIYQEFYLVPHMTVAENVFLGNEYRKGKFVDRDRMEREAKQVFSQLGIEIDPQKPVAELSVAYQQLVEIAKSISKKSKILIMDEPSAPLTEHEVKIMLDLVLKLKQSGVTIIYISHRLDEVFQISDRISVLRDGQYITTLQTKETNLEELINYMVGRSLNEVYPHREKQYGDVMLDVRNVSGNGVKDASFVVRKGEILGFGGLVGAKRTELMQLIFGKCPLEHGEIYFHGKKLKGNSPEESIRVGIGLIPEDRKKHGVLLQHTIQDNICLPILERISKFKLISAKKERDVTDRQVQKLSIKTPSILQLAKNLSGGNQQKVVLAKWLAADCDLLIFDEPTRGIDVGSRQEIYKLMNDLVQQGKSIIMVSSEMEELLGMSDRIIVLREGVICGELDEQQFSQERILMLASGH